MDCMNEFFFYMLVGQLKLIVDFICEVCQGEVMGFGLVFIFECFNVKEVVMFLGVVGVVLIEFGIVIVVMNQNIWYFVVMVVFGLMMYCFIGGCFLFGFGCGILQFFKVLGFVLFKMVMIEDFVQFMCRMWVGEMIVGYDGLVGSYFVFFFGVEVNDEILFIFIVFGLNLLVFGGCVFDVVVLYIFFIDEMFECCVKIVKQVVEEVGCDLVSVCVWLCFVIIGDYLFELLCFKKMVGCMVIYFQVYGDFMVCMNDWDFEVFVCFCVDLFVVNFQGVIDYLVMIEQFEQVVELIFEEWFVFVV